MSALALLRGGRVVALSPRAGLAATCMARSAKREHIASRILLRNATTHGRITGSVDSRDVQSRAIRWQSLTVDARGKPEGQRRWMRGELLGDFVRQKRGSSGASARGAGTFVRSASEGTRRGEWCWHQVPVERRCGALDAGCRARALMHGGGGAARVRAQRACQVVGGIQRFVYAWVAFLAEFTYFLLPALIWWPRARESEQEIFSAGLDGLCFTGYPSRLPPKRRNC